MTEIGGLIFFGVLIAFLILLRLFGGVKGRVIDGRWYRGKMKDGKFVKRDPNDPGTPII